MKTVVTALLAGASMLASAPASAADFIRYTFAASATGSLLVNDRASGQTLSKTQALTGNYVIVIPISAVGQSTFSYSGDTATRPFSFTSNSTSITFTSSNSNVEAANGVNFSASLTACGDFGFGAPAAATAFNPMCSPVRTFYGQSRAPNPFGDTVEGTITSFSVERFSADSAVIGFNQILSTPAIPEPSTWAFMILGFAAISASLRRRGQIDRLA